MDIEARAGDALIVIDPQLDFCPGGALAVAGGDEIMAGIAQLAERFGAVSMTLEMPFKDNDDLPDPDHGWSPERSRALGRSCLDALHAIIDELPKKR